VYYCVYLVGHHFLLQVLEIKDVSKHVGTWTDMVVVIEIWS